MRFRGQQRHFWLLTVNRMDFCAATVPSMRCCLAISEEKAMSLAIVAAWLVVDRCNYIINDVCVLRADRTTRATGCRLSVPELSCERLMRRPAVGQPPDTSDSFGAVCLKRQLAKVSAKLLRVASIFPAPRQ
jgi:hypothetical protein